MINKIFNLFSGIHYRYLLNGLIIFYLNLLISEYILSYSFFKENNYFLVLGNLISIEISILISFPIHNYITWLLGNEGLWKRFILYHKVLLISVLIRIILFSFFISIELSIYFSNLISILFMTQLQKVA
jgi:hypothetical protein